MSMVEPDASQPGVSPDVSIDGNAEAAASIDAALGLLDRIQGQIASADEKIRALFSGTALLVVALTFNAPDNLAQYLVGGWRLSEVIELAAYSILLILVCISVISALVALLPRIKPLRSDDSLFFFGFIAAHSHDDFIAKFKSMSDRDALTQILSQAHVSSLIAQDKFRWTRRAAASFIAAIVVWVIFKAVSFVT